MAITQPVPRPVAGCEDCQTGYQNLIDLYKLMYRCPDDPGAKGIFDAEREDYEAHHQESHKAGEMKPGDLAVSRGQQDGAKHDEIHGNGWRLSVKATAELEATKLFPGNDVSGFRLVYVEMYKMACREARQKRKESEAASCSPDK